MFTRLRSPRLLVGTGCAAAAAAGGSSAMALANDSRRPILFFSDLDGTLVGCPQGLQTWKKFWDSEERGSILCYNTGRCITSYATELAPILPAPDVLITGDGLEIRWQREGALVLDKEWERRVRAQWIDAGLGERVCARLQPEDEGWICDLNITSNSPPNGEARFAVSVAGEERAHALARAVEAELGEQVNSYVMRGWDREGRSHVVVVLPSIAGKANAASYVQARLEIPDERCVAAGDSENDISIALQGMFFIAVANATPGLVAALGSRSAPPGQQYRASAAKASGVVEGLRYFRARMLEASAAGAGGC